MFRFTCLALFLLGGFTAPTCAQWEVGSGGLGTLPLGPAALSHAGLGYGGRLSVSYALSYKFRVGIALAWWQTGYADSTSASPAYEQSQAFGPIMITGAYDFLRRERWQVAGELALGIASLRSIRQFNAPSARLVYSGTALTLQPSASIRYALTDALRVEGRLGYGVALTSTAEGLAKGGMSHWVELGAGVSWRWQVSRYPRHEPTRRKVKSRPAE